MAEKAMNLTLKIWRQKNRNSPGAMETYQISGVNSDM